MRAGKVRYIGCSNFSGWHLMKSLAVVGPLRLPALRRAPGLLLAAQPRLRVGADAARPRPGRRRAWSGARSAGASSPARSAAASRAKPGTRAHDIAGTGPHFDEERLFRIVDALDEVAKETGKTIPQVALNWLLQRPTVVNAHHRRPQRGAAGREHRRGRLEADAEQVATLDAASDVAPAYPVWHQRGFPMLNERATA